VSELSASPWSRSFHRTAHLLLATILGIYLYSPLSGASGVELLVQTVVFPGLALSGLFLWKGHRLRRALLLRQSPTDE